MKNDATFNHLILYCILFELLLLLLLLSYYYLEIKSFDSYNINKNIKKN